MKYFKKIKFEYCDSEFNETYLLKHNKKCHAKPVCCMKIMRSHVFVNSNNNIINNTETLASLNEKRVLKIVQQRWLRIK